jgi:23S rRNA (adenine2030-N6)-methyltransferase
LASRAWPELLIVELMIRGATIADRLNGCGLIVANPPYSLAAQLATVLPELARRLAIGPGAGYRLDRLISPSAASQERRLPANTPTKR